MTPYRTAPHEIVEQPPERRAVAFSDSSRVVIVARIPGRWEEYGGPVMTLAAASSVVELGAALLATLAQDAQALVQEGDAKSLLTDVLWPNRRDRSTALTATRCVRVSMLRGLVFTSTTLRRSGSAVEFATLAHTTLSEWSATTAGQALRDAFAGCR